MLARIRALMNSSDAEGMQSYGLISVSKRLRLFFGDVYRMEIESELDVGTTVHLYIPALREEQINATLRSRMI